MRVLISLAPQQTQQVLALLEQVGATVIEHLTFIDTYFAEVPVTALETIATHPGVLYVGFRKYRPAVKGIGWGIQNRAKYNIRVMNIGHGPYPPFNAKPFVPNDPVNLATKRAFEQGITVVVAAGNWGPQNATLNPWSAAPWVIGVGAAINQTTLANTSSRGDPADGLHIPTVVAIGEGPEVGDGPMPPPGSWTSFAAPRVSFLALVCIEFIETLRSFMDKNSQAITVGDEYCIAIVDTGVDETKVPKRLAGGRVRILPEVGGKLIALDEFLRSRNIPCAISTAPETVKMMLQAMAVQMDGKPHEVGAGYVDEKTAIRYLRSFGARNFVQLFARGAITAREEKELNQIDAQLGPFSSNQEIDATLDYCRDINFIDIRSFSGCDSLFDPDVSTC